MTSIHEQRIVPSWFCAGEQPPESHLKLRRWAFGNVLVVSVIWFWQPCISEKHAVASLSTAVVQVLGISLTLERCVFFYWTVYCLLRLIVNVGWRWKPTMVNKVYSNSLRNPIKQRVHGMHWCSQIDIVPSWTLLFVANMRLSYI